MPRSALSADEARQIALAAQGFTSTPPARVGPTAMHAAIARLGVIQMDSVNVLVRSHYLPLFSRLGAYRREALDDLAYSPRRRTLFEYWGHEASLLPLDAYPLFRWRMERAARGVGTWKHVARVARDRPQLVEHVEREVRDRGPLAAGELADEPRSRGGWWGWSDHKSALEFLFWSGRITTATRRNFERVYDLCERVLPEVILSRARQDDASQQRELVRRASRALGVATARDLRDYFRLPAEEARARVEELVESGELERVTVEGWKEPALLAAGVRMPRRSIHAEAVLSPFDSLVWDRARTERLFGFRFRLEIYTPAHKRVHGYYVLPFLLGDRLVARVDLKSDRVAGALLVKAIHVEPTARRRDVLPPLGEALQRLARWLGLPRVQK